MPLLHFLSNHSVFRLKAIGISVCLLFMGAFAAYGFEKPIDKAIAVVSLRIRPYVEALEALAETLSAEMGIQTIPVFLDNESGKSREMLTKRLAEADDATVFIAVGPEAAHLLWKDLSIADEKKIFTMVLNPEKALPLQQTDCGISLNIPIESQLRIIKQVLPSTHRIGLIYNPEYNAVFSGEARRVGLLLGLTIMPLEVADRKDIATILQRNREKIDALWMIPDQTVISESLVPFIIKEAIAKAVPVIGFNRFFYENGASLCYLFDYKGIGKQTGRLLLERLKGGACGNEPPEFKVWCNIKVMNALGVNYNADAIGTAAIGQGP